MNSSGVKRTLENKPADISGLPSWQKGWDRAWTNTPYNRTSTQSRYVIAQARQRVPTLPLFRRMDVSPFVRILDTASPVAWEEIARTSPAPPHAAAIAAAATRKEDEPWTGEPVVDDETAGGDSITGGAGGAAGSTVGFKRPRTSRSRIAAPAMGLDDDEEEDGDFHGSARPKRGKPAFDGIFARKVGSHIVASQEPFAEDTDTILMGNLMESILQDKELREDYASDMATFDELSDAEFVGRCNAALCDLNTGIPEGTIFVELFRVEELDKNFIDIGKKFRTHLLNLLKKFLDEDAGPGAAADEGVSDGDAARAAATGGVAAGKGVKKGGKTAKKGSKPGKKGGAGAGKKNKRGRNSSATCEKGGAARAKGAADDGDDATAEEDPEKREDAEAVVEKSGGGGGRGVRSRFIVGAAISYQGISPGSILHGKIDSINPDGTRATIRNKTMTIRGNSGCPYVVVRHGDEWINEKAFVKQKKERNLNNDVT